MYWVAFRVGTKSYSVGYVQKTIFPLGWSIINCPMQQQGCLKAKKQTLYPLEFAQQYPQYLLQSPL